MVTRCVMLICQHGLPGRWWWLEEAADHHRDHMRWECASGHYQNNPASSGLPPKDWHLRLMPARPHLRSPIDWSQGMELICKVLTEPGLEPVTLLEVRTQTQTGGIRPEGSQN